LKPLAALELEEVGKEVLCVKKFRTPFSRVSQFLSPQFSKNLYSRVLLFFENNEEKKRETVL
jgi:hypothetical protein